MSTSTLLPCIEGIAPDSIVSTDKDIVLRLSTVASSVACPLCGWLSDMQNATSNYGSQFASGTLGIGSLGAEVLGGILGPLSPGLGGNGIGISSPPDLTVEPKGPHTQCPLM